MSINMIKQVMSPAITIKSEVDALDIMSIMVFTPSPPFL